MTQVMKEVDTILEKSGINKFLALALLLPTGALLLTACFIATVWWITLFTVENFLPEFIARPLNTILFDGPLNLLGLS